MTPETTLPQDPPDILIVDDTLANLQLLSGMLKARGYKARAALTGKLALQAAESAPPDLILLDISMPEMDGYEVCERLKADPQLKEIPVLFVSAHYETMDKVRAFRVGGVDYITKPYQFDEIHARVETHLKLRRLQLELEHHNQHLQELVQAQVKEIADSQMAAIFALAQLAESRDHETGQHLKRVQLLSRLLATKLAESSRYREYMDAPYIDNLYHASPLHDIGKVALPDRILLKPEKLTRDEIEVMQTHTIHGAQTLEAVRRQYPKNSFINMGIAIARAHHERWDGSGYPDGLKGEEIPFSARIMAVVDVYDALRTMRCYKPAFSHEKARELIVANGETQFDPTVVAAFVDLEEEFAQVRASMED